MSDVDKILLGVGVALGTAGTGLVWRLWPSRRWILGSLAGACYGGAAGILAWLFLPPWHGAERAYVLLLYGGVTVTLILWLYRASAASPAASSMAGKALAPEPPRDVEVESSSTSAKPAADGGRAEMANGSKPRADEEESSPGDEAVAAAAGPVKERITFLFQVAEARARIQSLPHSMRETVVEQAIMGSARDEHRAVLIEASQSDLDILANAIRGLDDEEKDQVQHAWIHIQRTVTQGRNEAKKFLERHGIDEWSEEGQSALAARGVAALLEFLDRETGRQASHKFRICNT